MASHLTSRHLVTSLKQLRTSEVFRCGGRRFKGNIMPHRKPRWVPLADSTLLRHPPRNMAPEGEVEQCNRLHFHYHEHLSAITQYLHEERLKESSEAAVEEAEDRREHERLLRENEEINAQVAKRREARLQREREEMRLKVAKDLEEARVEEERRVQLARAEVAEEEADLAGAVVSAAQLDEAIADALDHPADHEFAIDLQGHIYRGRLTKSIDVPVEEREKIPAPPEWRTLQLGKEEAEGSG